MKKMVLFFVSILLVFLPGYAVKSVKASTEPDVSIKLVNYLGNQSQVDIAFKGEYEIPNTNLSLTEGNSYQVKAENNNLSLYENGVFLSSFQSFTAVPKIYGIDNYIVVEGRPYLGSMQFTLEKNAFVRPINTLPMEDYLKGVVPFEVYGSWNMEALKAQAVAARSYTVSHQQATIDDTVNYQAYGGYEWDSNTTQAVDDTDSQTLTYNGETIDAFYSDSNGGETESNADVWGGTPLLYYPVQKDPYDKKIAWRFTIHKQQIDTTGLDPANPETWWNSVSEADSPLMDNVKTWMAANGYGNYEIKIIAVPALSFTSDRTAGNRVKNGNISLQYFLKDKTTGSFVMDQNQIKVNTLTFTNTNASRIRTMVGINTMKSYLVTGEDESSASYTVEGLGNGHGVGMSQWGAKAMADQGFSYLDILSFYFPGTTFANAQGPLPSSPAGATAALAPAAAGNQQNNAAATAVGNQTGNPAGTASVNQPNTPAAAPLNGWVTAGGSRYYYHNGDTQTGWLYYGGKWFFFNKGTGVMATGWVMDGKWYYLKPSGQMTTGWLYDHGSWYYLSKNGAMATGWLLNGGKWYYLKGNGKMATGWVLSRGKWYYLYPTGIMASNAKIGSLRVGGDGAWIH